jgi:hypothetical protein
MVESPRRTAGDLWLRCEPTDAEVLVDGVPQGHCEDFDGQTRGLVVGEGMHRVEVKKEGFWPYVSYYAPSGARAALSVRLQPRERREEGAP